MSYSPFWGTVKDFQSLIGAGVSFLAVVGAIFGIALKTRLDEKSVARRAREERRARAASIWFWIDIERKLPDWGLLRVPTESEVAAMLVNPIGTSIGASKLIEYHANITAGLAEYPHPIADRASFISWTSARTILAIAQIGKAAESERDKLAHRYAEEMALLIRAGIQVVEDLSRELNIYREAPAQYEKAWAQAKPDERAVQVKFKGHIPGSWRFDAAYLHDQVITSARHAKAHAAMLEAMERDAVERKQRANE
jgi:hypothetical protein